MNQIKYLVNAFQMLLLSAALYFLIEKILSTEIVAKQPTAVDVDTPATLVGVINAQGKNLFYENCATCHALDKADGFNFKSIETRGPWVNRKNLIAWIKNPAATSQQFQYTRDLVEEFNGQMMPSFPNLTDAQIEAILDYLKQPQGFTPSITANEYR